MKQLINTHRSSLSTAKAKTSNQETLIKSYTEKFNYSKILKELSFDAKDMGL